MIEEIQNIDKPSNQGVQSSWASFSIIVNREGKIKFITNEFALLLGYSINDLLGKNAIDVLIQDQEREERRLQLDFLYKQESLIDTFDTVLLSSNDAHISMRFNILKLQSADNTTEDIAFVGDNLAITKKVKADLSNEQKQVEQILDSTREFVIIIDKNEILSTVNDVARRKLGFKAGMSLRQVLDPIDVKHTTSFLNSLGKISSTANINLVLLHPTTRKRFYLAGAVSSTVEDGQLINFRLILHDVTEKTKSEKAKDLYYSIAHHSIHSKNLDELYYNIHKELKVVVDCENLYIALTDGEDEERVLTFPYYQEGEFTNKRRTQRKFGLGLTEFIINAQKPKLFTKKELVELTKKDKIVLHGTLPEIWLGVPLKVKGEVIGAIAIQSYHSESFYSSRDLKLLDFASSQIAMAIDMVRTQEKLKAQTAKLNSIIESGSHLIWTVNSNLELTSFNKNYFDAIINNYDVLPSVQEGALEDIRTYPRFWEDNYAKALKGEQVNFEIALKDNDGNNIWKEIYLNPIYLEGGKIEEVSGIANDITEKKKSAQALVESEEKFRNIFESFQDVYFRCSRNGVINMVSPSVETLTGRSVDTVMGSSITSYIKQESLAISLLRRLIKDGEIKNVEVTVAGIDGQLIESICNLRFLKGQEGKVSLIEGVVRDVTLLKLTNRELIQAKDLAEESLMVKEQFLANMSHEIRTPLNGIIGVVDLIEHTDLEKEQKSYLKTIKSSSETLLNILNDILDLSKIEAGKMQLHIEPISIKRLVKKVKSLFASRATSNLIKLNFHLGSDIPEVIEADGMRLIQVISNLLANSIKFTPRGGSIDIGFELKEKDGDDVTIRIDVRDSGIGIKREDVDRLFSSFTQLDTSTTKAYGGTGLGLSIAKELVELMEGQIGVSSSPGLGSTFWFNFKAKKSNKKIISKAKVKKPSKSLLKFTDITPNILVVDDNLVNREVAGEILKKCGCDVDLASNGIEAVFKSRSKAYDIIFMDIQMPEMDGIEANRQIKAQVDQHQPVVVAMTAYSMKEDKQRFLDEGLDDYLAKPIRATEIINMVDDLIKGNITNSNSENEYIASSEIINKDVIEQLKKFGGMEMLVNAFKEFEDEAKIQIMECSKALKSKDYDLIKKHLHTLKGSAGTLGIDKVASVAKVTEGAMKEEDYSNLSNGLKELNDSFVEFRQNFTNIISNY